MVKKLGIVVMAGLFSLSVAGLSFADEMKKHEGMPMGAGAPANPCAGKEMKKKEDHIIVQGVKKGNKAATKTGKKGASGVTMDPLPAEKK